MTLFEILDKYNFEISSTAEISKKFRELEIKDFREAAKFVKQLPYRRNKNKNDLATLFSDGFGTCGTKHALLKRLADENSVPYIQLTIGIFKMNAENSAPVAATLKKHKIDYLPEAHTYLYIHGEFSDFTWPNSGIPDFKKYLLSEIAIEPGQITDFKVAHHRAFMEEWLKTQDLPYPLDELWAIREQCIHDLSQKND